MLRVTGVFICLLATIVCLIESLPTTEQAAAEYPSQGEEVNTFRQEMTELKELVRLLQEQLIVHGVNVASKGEPVPHELSLIDRLARRRRDVDTDLSRPFTNESDANNEYDLNQVYLGYHSLTPTGGTVYSHWGRSDCTDGSELVYEGTTAGEYYSHTGSGSNYLCMPLEPIYDEVETSAHASRGRLYSAEFETSTAPALSDLHDHTPACAVCRAPPTRMTKLMIPGRNECPSSKWRLEYKGYLMSALYTHQKTEFICMDREAEAVPGTSGNQNGANFYMVEGRCMSGGGLPCGPYVNGHELTCAVCTI